MAAQSKIENPKSKVAERLKPLEAIKGLESTHLLINEIYASIQGESTHAGRPCTFIRTAVCNQRCSYCDTAYAFTQGEAVHIDEVVRRALIARDSRFEVRDSGTAAAGTPNLEPRTSNLVEITGGEPLLQPLFPELCRRLLDAACEVLVETGGSHDISVVPEGVRVILDIKTPGSREEHANDYGNLQRLRLGDEVKFVLTSRTDYEWSRDLMRQERLHERTTVLFSPAWNVVDPAELVAWMLEDGVPARLNLQLHKYVWGNRRGV
jgi:7-carboxy-7-deazaguanine synthase